MKLPARYPSQLDIRISVYSGLTLSAEEVATSLPSAVLRPPAKQFDLLADIRDGTHVVLIVDGVFHQSPAVSPAEIMDALRRGILVYGCSSMGAMRAAELMPYGMRGIGKIFDWVCRDPTFRDDFLAQTFSSEAERIHPLSVPFVDFAFNVRQLARRKVIRPRDAQFLERTFRDLYYPDRTLAALLALLTRQRPDLGGVARRALLSMPSQKKRDALLALRRIRSDLSAVQANNHALGAGPEALSTLRMKPRVRRQRRGRLVNAA